MRAVHAVEAAGVHPLLLALGSERYVPYREPRRPRELLTLANALLGHGQLSLAKYLWIAAAEDNPDLDVRHVPDFLRHMLERVDWRRDLHFQTCTTIDTLDYSGERLERGLEGGHRRRRAAAAHAAGGHRQPRWPCPRRWASASRGSSCRASWWSKGPPYARRGDGPDRVVDRFCDALQSHRRDQRLSRWWWSSIRADFAARTLDNFLWTTFTRSNPATDIYGIEAFLPRQALGLFRLAGDRRPEQAASCPAAGRRRGSDQRVDALAARGGPLHGLI